jgi:hypothetical protein
MHYGIVTANLGDYADPRVAVRLACAAEAAGWEAFFVWDHLGFVRGVPSGDPYVILSAVAASTTHLKLGLAVTPLARRRPQVVANALASLDLLSGGRAIFGAGLGGVAEEFSAFGVPMKLLRLEHHQHPRPPHHELRQKNVLDSGFSNIGQVANLYVDDDRELQFVDVVTSGFLGFGKKHHLVPVEAIANEDPGSVTLKVAQQSVEDSPTIVNPDAGPDDELQRTTREHYGYS